MVAALRHACLCVLVDDGVGQCLALVLIGEVAGNAGQREQHSQHGE